MTFCSPKYISINKDFLVDANNLSQLKGTPTKTLKDCKFDLVNMDVRVDFGFNFQGHLFSLAKPSIKM